MTKYKQRRSKKRGGFWPFTSSDTTTSNVGYGTSTENSGNMMSSIGSSIGNYWNKAKEGASSLFNSNTNAGLSTYTPTTTSYTPMSNSSVPPPPPYNPPPYGGRKSRRKMRAGYKPNVSLTNIASHAAPFSGITARPHTWVGGKTRRRRHKCTKRCRHRKH